MSWRFFQFSLRQMALLVGALAVLLALLTPPFLKRAESRRHDTLIREAKRAEQDLLKAVVTDNANLGHNAIERGADPKGVSDGFQRDWPLLHRCIRCGSADMFRSLLQHFPELLVSEGPPLFAVVVSKHSFEIRREMIETLVEHGVDVRVEVNGWTAMSHAVKLYDAEMGDLLRKHGAEYGPREMVAFNRLEELKRAIVADPAILSQRYPPIYAAHPGKEPTLLGTALLAGHREVAEFLIEQGAPLHVREGLGENLMHQAARGGQADLVRLLATRGVDVDAVDEYNETPLMDVSGRANVGADVIAALIEAGTDVNRIGVFGTALHRAVSTGDPEIIRMLMAAGADPTIPDHRGSTPVDLADKRRLEIKALLERRE